MSLNFTITADNRNFLNSLVESQRAMDSTVRNIESSGMNIESFFTRIGRAAALLGTSMSLGEFTQQIFQTRSEIQSLETSFNNLLGSESKAKAMFSQIREYAVHTPMMLNDLASSAQMMLSFNIPEGDVMTYLKAIGDISMGDAQKFQSLSLAFSQASSTGKLMGQDLMQMINAGFNPLATMSERTGKSISELKDEMSAGTISAKMMQQAFIDATSEGGKYYGMLESQSQTLGGAMSNLQGAMDDMFNSIGEEMEGIFSTSLNVATSVVQHWDDAFGAIAVIAGSFGIQKAVEMGGMAYARSVTSYGYDVELQQLRALLPAKQEEEQTSLQQAVASGRLTEAKAAEIAATREQVNAQLEELTAKEAAAKAEEATALQKAQNAAQELADADEMVNSYAEKLEALTQLGDAEQIEAAYTELETAEALRNEMANIANTASEEARTAATNAAAAAEARQTLATQIDTAQTAGNTAATGILTIAKEKLAVAVAKVNAVIKANQFMIVTAAVIGLGTAIYKLCTAVTEEERMLADAKRASEELSASYDMEMVKLSELSKKLAETKKGSEEWKSVKDAIVAKYGKYNSNLDEEISKTGALASSYDTLAESIRKTMLARAMDEYDKNNEIDFTGTQQKISQGLEGSFTKWEDTGRKDEYMRPIYEKKQVFLTEKSKQEIRKAITSYMAGADISLTKQLKEYIAQIGVNGLTGNNALKELEAERRKALAKKEGGKQIAKDFGASEKEAELLWLTRGATSNDIKEDETPKDSRKYWEEEVKKRKNAYESILKTDKEGSAQAKKAYEEAVAELNKYNTIEKTSRSGQTADQIASKEKEANQKLIDLMKQQTDERLKAQKEHEMQLWQNRIDLMSEGEAKTIAQMRLDQQKERDTIQEELKNAKDAEIARQKALFDAQEDVKAAGNKKYAKKVFNPTTDVDQSKIKVIKDRYKELNDQLLRSQKKAEQERLDAAKESMNAYLKEFGNYQQKRKALNDEYDKKISAAQNQGERMQLIGQKDKALADLDYSEWVESGDIALAFGNIENLSKDTINKLISDMERYRDRVLATFDPQKIKDYEEALTALRDVQADDSFFDTTNEITESLKNRLSLQRQLADEEARQSQLIAQKDTLEQELKSLTEQIFATTQAPGIAAVDPLGEKQQPPIVDEKDVRRADQLRVQLANVSKTIDQSAKNSDRLESSLRKTGKVKFSDMRKFAKQLSSVGNAASSLASIFSDDLADSINSGVNAFGNMIDAVDTVASNIDALAKGAKDAVKDTVDASKDIVDGASSGMKATAATTATSLSTMEKASAILAIIGAAIQLATMVASLFNNDKSHQKNIERLQDQIDALEKSYKRLGKAADNAFSVDASNLISQQNQLLLQQKVLIKQQMAEEEAKKKTDKDKIKDYQDRLDEIDETLEDNKKKAKEAIIGTDIKSAINDFAEAYAGAWEDGTDAAQKSMAAVKGIITSALNEMLKSKVQPFAQTFYDKLAEAMEKGYLTDSDLVALDAIKAQMDGIAEGQRKQYEEILQRYKDLDELREELTDISFDSVRDNFKSKLMDMESDAASFKEDFSEMLRSAITESLMDTKYDAMLKEWYQDFADAMHDQSLTDEKRDSLRQQYEDIINQGLADRNAINDLIGGGSYSQTASTGGWESMGQDTAEELNGRFTALTELEVINNDLNREQNAIALQILSAIQGLSLYSSDNGDDSTLLAIKDMMFLSTGYLEDIARYTKMLISIAGGIDKLKDIMEKRL